jgi:methyltransferase family protein
LNFRSLFRRRPFNLAAQQSRSWLRRAEDAALLVARIPDLARPIRVVDLGAGDKKLAKALASHYDVRYTGYDKHPQSDDIEAWELRAGLPSELGDVCFALGLLEYVDALSDFFRQAAPSCRHFIFSYVTSDSGAYSAERRERLGWRTHYSAAEIERIVSAAGLDVLARVDNADDGYSIWLTASPRASERASNSMPGEK